jgi:hypothetical protein
MPHCDAFAMFRPDRLAANRLDNSPAEAMMKIQLSS